MYTFIIANQKTLALQRFDRLKDAHKVIKFYDEASPNSAYILYDEVDAKVTQCKNIEDCMAYLERLHYPLIESILMWGD